MVSDAAWAAIPANNRCVCLWTAAAAPERAANALLVDLLRLAAWPAVAVIVRARTLATTDSVEALAESVRAYAILNATEEACPAVAEISRRTDRTTFDAGDVEAEIARLSDLITLAVWKAVADTFRAVLLKTVASVLALAEIIRPKALADDKVDD
jgi:hypothetical protein